MIFLQATSLSQNLWIAIVEAIVLLALAAYIGWWIARRTLSVRLAGLQNSIDASRNDLDDCRRSNNHQIGSNNSTAMGTGITAPVANSLVAAAPISTSDKDDLKLIEGIGPKIEELLNNEGILTFAALANSPAEQLKGILDAAGSRFQIHDPTTWPQQSALARDGKWDELKTLQDELNKGRLS